MIVTVNPAVTPIAEPSAGPAAQPQESGRQWPPNGRHRILSDLKPVGAGLTKKALEPNGTSAEPPSCAKVGADTMVLKGCAVMGLFCKEQRWTQ